MTVEDKLKEAVGRLAVLKDRRRVGLWRLQDRTVYVASRGRCRGTDGDERRSEVQRTVRRNGGVADGE